MAGSRAAASLIAVSLLLALALRLARRQQSSPIISLTPSIIIADQHRNSTPPPQLTPFNRPLIQSPPPDPPSSSPPSPPARPLPSWSLELLKRGKPHQRLCRKTTLHERGQMLRGNCKPIENAASCPLGLRHPLRYRLSAVQSRRHRHLWVEDKLQQPSHVPDEANDCFFAFVDPESAAFVVSTAPKAVRRAGTLTASRVGAWRLLTLPKSTSPYAQPRRASRVPKLLPFRFFPRCKYSLWIDGKLRLLVPPMELVQKYLIQPRAQLSLQRNLKRDHIDEEVRWIEGTLSEEPEKLSGLHAVKSQWRFYRDEQEGSGNWSDSSSSSAAAAASDDSEEEPPPPSPWMLKTACAEGAMILTDLQSPLARCALCAWFNEWHRFSERDQLAFSYVLHMMGLTPPMLQNGATEPDEQVEGGWVRKDRRQSHKGVYLWPRHDHWNYKRNKKRAAEARPYVRYVGHGGCAQSKEDLKISPILAARRKSRLASD